MKVLALAQECNPAWASVPLVAWNLLYGASRLADMTLVTHERNRDGIRSWLEAHGPGPEVVFVPESRGVRAAYRAAGFLAGGGDVNWQLLHALAYPVHAEFNRRAAAMLLPRLRAGEFSLLHAMTPIQPRYGYSLVRKAGGLGVPTLLGPVNGGLPYPPGFSGIAVREHASFDRLRALAGLVPGYRATYLAADRILAGSSHTLGMLASRFPSIRNRLELFHENGVAGATLGRGRRDTVRRDRFRLLFVGRLTPYKGCHLLLEAMAGLGDVRGLRLTVVGDGPQREELEAMARESGIADRVRFTGWVAQERTREYYEAADLFVFPSVREFGGAVVLEAMAAGLPCVVADHGGIGEYVTPESGVAVRPLSPEQMAGDVARAVRGLVRDRERWRRLSAGAAARARRYAWETKAAGLAGIYAGLADPGAGP